jgi:hypothetical protein
MALVVMVGVFDSPGSAGPGVKLLKPTGVQVKGIKYGVTVDEGRTMPTGWVGGGNGFSVEPGSTNMIETTMPKIPSAIKVRMDRPS